MMIKFLNKNCFQKIMEETNKKKNFNLQKYNPK